MLKTILAASLVAGAGLAPLPFLAVAAHAQDAGTAPMQDAGTAGEHVNKKSMAKSGKMKKSSMKKHGMKHKM